MLRLFGTSRDHLDAVNESYLEHLSFAGRTGLTMIVAGSACVVHGLMPFLFDRTGSRTIERLASRLRERSRHPTQSEHQQQQDRGSQPTYSWT